MTTTLSEGVKIPDVGSTDWADDLETNWNLLNTALAQQGSWAKVDEAQTFTGVQTFSDGIVGSLQGTANMAMSDADGNTITSTYATKTELSTLSTTVGTKANDSDVVHKADAETITGAKTFSATLTSADVVPSATDTYSLGSASVQYNAVYGKSYYYNGTQWGLDRDNTWTGVNTFTANNLYLVANNPAHILKSSTMQEGVVPSEHHTAYSGYWVDKNTNVLGHDRFVFYSSGAQTYEVNIRNKATNGSFDPSGSQIQSAYQLTLYPSGNSDLKIYAHTLPNGNNMWDLGDSTHKWKSLNGVNPGALSLPSTTYTNIDTTGWSTTGSGNTYTPTLDGWVYVRITGGSGNYISVKRGGSSAGYPCDTREGTALAYIALTVPVSSGQSIIISINGTIEQCRFIPCFGNV